MKNCYLYLLLVSCFCFGQKDLNQQLRLTIDNDKIVLTDKYYTSGLFVDYTRMLGKDFLFLKAEESKNQLRVVLGSEVYTPTNIKSTNTLTFDRPYAGWSFVKTALSQIKQNKSHAYEIEIGVSGQMSAAGRLQSWWHHVLEVDVPTWTQEIENKFLVNLKTQHVFNFDIGNNVALDYKVEPALGLKDVYLENSVSLYIGKLNSFNNSSRSGVVDFKRTHEIYVVASIAYKYVAHNTLIQGDLRYDDKTFTSAIVNGVLKTSAGLVYKSERHLWQLSLNYNTKETPKSSSHTYGSLSYGFMF